MSRLTHFVTASLPYSPEMAVIAAKIGRALDQDIGGAASFTREIIGGTEDSPVYGDTLRCGFPCSDGFADNLMGMLADHDLLHFAVCADYAYRWRDLAPPSLEECRAFMAAVRLEISDNG